MKWMVRSLQIPRCVSETLLCGPLFEVGDRYFDKGKSSRESKFERHCDKVQKAFSGFRTAYCKERYLKTFSSSKVEGTAPIEKSHSFPLKLCACASQFADLQMGFPMKPFFCPRESENECVQNMCANCLQPPNKALQELAANLGTNLQRKSNEFKKQQRKRFFARAKESALLRLAAS